MDIFFFNASALRFEMNNVMENRTGGGPIYGGAIDVITEAFNLRGNNVFSNMNSQMNREINFSNGGTSGYTYIILDSNYYGTTNASKINRAIYDFPESGQGIWFDISKKLDRPLRQAHGIVWKVEVNGKDAQDQFEQLDPLGVGQHTFKVYFNRPMDVQFPPMVSMGVRNPYTQTAIATNGSWSADSTIYTVYGTVGLTTGDGINTIRVTGARDTDYFEIPVEDHRFRVIVNGAGSLSAGFMATPGMGKVMLEWCNPAEGVNDLLGYNMYRYFMINDTVSSDTVMINPVLITDTVYTDFNVEPGTRYFYTYKTVRTNLTESDHSQVVTAVPLTADAGDANGDMAVNVLDVTTIIAFLIDQNPQPFIFEAADVINDSVINILDVVGVVNLISGHKKVSVAENPPAYLYLKAGFVQLQTTQAVSGLQFEIEGSDPDQVRLYTKLEGFELVTAHSKGRIIGVLYSFHNRSIPLGLQRIIEIEGPTEQLRWGALLASDPEGNPVSVIADEDHSWSLADCYLHVYPNPFGREVNIAYTLHEDSQVTLEILDFYGRVLTKVFTGNQTTGNWIQAWTGKGDRGGLCEAGVYLLRLTASGISGKKITRYAKLVKTQ